MPFFRTYLLKLFACAFIRKQCASASRSGSALAFKLKKRGGRRKSNKMKKQRVKASGNQCTSLQKSSSFLAFRKALLRNRTVEENEK